MDRSSALDRVDALLEAVETGPLPVPVREVWVYGDIALGLDPVDRLDVYVTKDLLLRGDDAAGAAFEAEHPDAVVSDTVGTGDAACLEQRRLVDFATDWFERNRG